MKRLRLASPEEVDSIRSSSDLDPTCIVLALDTEKGPILGVVRTVIEVDPVYFPDECADRMKLFFMRDVETFLSAKGVASYYFNLSADNLPLQSVMKHWGAEQTSKNNELRFKINL